MSENFSYTPFGWFLVVTALCALIGIGRSALCPDPGGDTPPEPQVMNSGWAIVYLAIGFLFGIPAALALGPEFGSAFKPWLNSFGQQCTVAIVSGIIVGGIALDILVLADCCRAIARRIRNTRPYGRFTQENVQ